MRLALTGSHATGKSTLLAELARRTSRVTIVEEPYHRLVAAGHAFGFPPTIADFETLFDASLATMAEHHETAVAFDRTPADYLAYLVALQPGRAMTEAVADAVRALQTLDLVVYVPIEHPDRICESAMPRLRRRVDAILREILVDQSWGWTGPLLEVHGTLAQRVATLTRHSAAVRRIGTPSDLVVELPDERCS